MNKIMQKLKRISHIKSWDDFIKHGALMLIAMGLVNILALLYQLFMARNLTIVNYGVLNSLLSFYVIFAIPAGSMQVVITKFVSKFRALGQLEKLESLLLNLARKAFYFGLIILFLFVIAGKPIASFLHIESAVYIILLGAIIFISCLVPLGLGGLNGLQQFSQMGITMVTNAGVKLVLGIILVVLGFKVFGALIAIVLGAVVAFVLSFYFFNNYLNKNGLRLNWSYLKNPLNNSQIGYSEIYRYFWPVASSLLCFMILTNSDIVLVKHFFTPLEAGYYSLSQFAGKMILFLPGAISLVMFPKSSDSHAKKKDTRLILKKSLIAAASLCFTAALIFIIYPQIISYILNLSSETYLKCRSLIRLFSIAMAFFALNHVLICYHLSVHNLKYIFPLFCCVFLQILLISLWHPSLHAVLVIMCCSSFVLLLLNLKIAKDGLSK